ncbi:MAG TPA: I78 family peptidase inhibitor [Caulobacteraceae bacterium]|nr:I78 family peptidase inhibitor [Caulobacteraceae bacterium]
MLRPLAIAAVVALSACASAPDAAEHPSVQRDIACGAPDYQYLVGKNRSEIPAAPAGAIWRVHSTEDAVTMDYNPRRLNIVWDAKTGIVKTVSCG